jgi:hypothetical protein
LKKRGDFGPVRRGQRNQRGRRDEDGGAAGSTDDLASHELYMQDSGAKGRSGLKEGG